MKAVFLGCFCIFGIEALTWNPFGSGLDSNVILPIRYFYVDVTDDNGQRVHGKDLKGNLLSRLFTIYYQRKIRNQFGLLGCFLRWETNFLMPFRDTKCLITLNS